MPDIFTTKAKTPDEPQTEAERATLFGHTHSPLAAYNYYPDPDKINFETQEDGENIVLLLRRHIITNVGWIVIAVLMVLAPAVLNFFPLLSFLPTRFQFVAILIWYLVTTAFILENFLSWFFNVYIVTNERVIDVDFYSLIYKQVSDANLDKIQDINYHIGGVIRTLFNYGDVVVQTAAEVPNFEFEDVPSPDKVAKILQQLIQEEEAEGTPVRPA